MMVFVMSYTIWSGVFDASNIWAIKTITHLVNNFPTSAN